MKTIISILLSLATLFPAAARIVLCDDNCKVEFSATTENEPRFAVVSPAGMPTVEIIQQERKKQYIYNILYGKIKKHL